MRNLKFTKEYKDAPIEEFIVGDPAFVKSLKGFPRRRFKSVMDYHHNRPVKMFEEESNEPTETA